MPQGRSNIRYAVSSYRQSMAQFTQGVSGALNGRSVIYSYANHCFLESKHAYEPIDSVQALWEKDHLVHAIVKFVENIFSGMDRPDVEQKKIDLTQTLKEKCIKVVLQNDCPNTAQLAAAKSRMDDYLNELLEITCAFETASTSLSVPGHGEYTSSLTRSFPATTTASDGWKREYTTAFYPNTAEEEKASSFVSTESFTEQETSRSGSSGRNLFVLFLINVRKVILAVFNWFTDQFV